MTDGVFVNPPSWYVINKDSKNQALAKKFLNDLVFSDAGMIPAFANGSITKAQFIDLFTKAIATLKK